MDDNIKPYAIGAVIVVILLIVSRGASSAGTPGYRSMAPLANPAEDALRMQEQKDKTGLLTSLLNSSTSLDSLSINWAGRGAENRARIDAINAEYGGRITLANIDSVLQTNIASIGAQRDVEVAGLNAATQRQRDVLQSGDSRYRTDAERALGLERERQTTARTQISATSAQDIARTNAQAQRDVASTTQRGQSQRNTVNAVAGVVNTVIKAVNPVCWFGGCR